MEANKMEIALSRVACLMDELDGNPINKSHWDGYHPMVYCKATTREFADGLVSNLCARLKKLDVTKFSLEMQMWWRDHQAADRRREELEAQRMADSVLRDAALGKLSAEERRVLGIGSKKESR